RQFRWQEGLAYIRHDDASGRQMWSTPAMPLSLRSATVSARTASRPIARPESGATFVIAASTTAQSAVDTCLASRLPISGSARVRRRSPAQPLAPAECSAALAQSPAPATRCRALAGRAASFGYPHAGNGLSGDALPTSGKAQPFGRGRLDADLRLLKPEKLCNA